MLAGEAGPSGFGGGGIASESGAIRPRSGRPGNGPEVGIGMGEPVAQIEGSLLRLALADLDGLAVAGGGSGQAVRAGDDGIEGFGAGCGLVEEIGALAGIYFGGGRGDGLAETAGFRRVSI